MSADHIIDSAPAARSPPVSSSSGSSPPVAAVAGAAAAADTAAADISGSSSEHYLRGDAMLRKYNIERFLYLVDKQQQPRRHLLQATRDPSLKWAPRDCPQVAASYADLQRRGFDGHHVALSLVGYSGPRTDKYGSFARPQYTYLHMPLGHLADFITQLHPADRFLAYVLTESAAPVHMYFDIDADLDRFGHLRGADDECIRVFMSALRDFFHVCFDRELDASCLLLLQATSAAKLSWHLHIRSEAFRDITHHRLFVQQFCEWLEQQQEQADAEDEAAPDHEAEVDSESASTAARRTLPLCCFKAVGSEAHEGHWQHIVDPQPYMKNQNLRAPYNRKPGKTALRVRRHEWDAYGELRVLGDGPSSSSVSVSIQAEVLFQAHPSLALPSSPSYVHLVMGPRQAPGGQRKRQSRARCSDEGAEARASNSSSSSSSSKGHKNKKNKKNITSAHDDGQRIPLTSAEELTVRAAVAPHLGGDVRFDEVYRWTGSGLSEVRGGGGSSVIRGVTTTGTSDCPSLRARQPHRSSMKHRSNRMRFTLGIGWQSFHCFDEGCRGHDQTVPWSVDEAALRLLTGAGTTDSSAECHQHGAQAMDTASHAAGSPVGESSALSHAHGLPSAAGATVYQGGIAFYEGRAHGSSDSSSSIIRGQQQAREARRYEQQQQQQHMVTLGVSTDTSAECEQGAKEMDATHGPSTASAAMVCSQLEESSADTELPPRHHADHVGQPQSQGTDSAACAAPTCDSLRERQARIAHYVTHNRVPIVERQMRAPHVNTAAGHGIDRDRVYAILTWALRSLQMEAQCLSASGISGLAVAVVWQLGCCCGASAPAELQARISAHPC